MPASIPEFVAHWKGSALSEKSGAQSHFNDLCAALGESPPAAADPAGTWYTFERGLTKTGGGHGWADVWRRGCFAWEYKGQHKDLGAAYQQLLQYREALENPPLLVTCDFLRFEVHTNFTNTVKRVYRFTLDDLLHEAPTADTYGLAPLTVLRACFNQPDLLHPAQTATRVTEEAAEKFSRIAASLRKRGVPAPEAARFLMRLLFCLFAEDIDLLPRRLFTELVEGTRTRPVAFSYRLKRLFQAMAVGDDYGNYTIRYFNGGLFEDDTVLDLTADDLVVLDAACALDWASIEPAIFGTLFERSLDPAKRGQLGAHYTSREDILLITEPVLMAPLRREWAAVQSQAQELRGKLAEAPTQAAKVRSRQALESLIGGFADRLAAVRVLDPACGSGNFLYVALKQLLDLEKEVRNFALDIGLSGVLRQVGPAQLYGIEVNEYAHALASIVVWIGYIQWVHDNGFPFPADPVLRPLDNIQRMDAILAYDAEGRPVEPPWPAADVIIGNPPFLGGKRLRTELRDDYVETLFALYADRVPREADLVTYWFEKARASVESNQVRRVGLLATQGIRGGANRKVLERIKASGNIFMAWRDREWVLDGASVHVSMIGFDNAAEFVHTLDGNEVANINSDLTTDLDLTVASRLAENMGIAFQGPVKVGHFDIEDSTAKAMISQKNSSGLSNIEVIKPWVNGADITGRARGMWLIDFDELNMEQAALFEAPFEYVKENVKPFRDKNNDKQRRTFWWRLGRSGGDLKKAKQHIRRVIVTPRVAKHRLFVWLDSTFIPDCELVAITRDDDYSFGVLQSKIHELWARRMGTQLREAESGFRYTATSTFETFPFPWPPGQEPADDPRVRAIAEAARALVAWRDAWLNPPGAPAEELKRRTLTNLYNALQAGQAPDLAALHAALDAAVLAAYGWPAALPDAAILERLLALNHARAAAPR